MKKIFFLLIITIISVFLINLDNVYAFECVYGKKEETKKSTGEVIGETWKKQITIEVSGYDDYNPIVNEEASPLIWIYNNYDPINKNVLDRKQENGLVYFYASYWSNPVTKLDFKLYLSIYPSQEVFNNSNNECPKILRFKYSTDINSNIYALYNDDLDSEQTNSTEHPFWKFVTNLKTKDEGYYVLESEKNKKADDLIDKYNCLTYTSYINKLKEAKNKFGTCDNNSEFTYQYDKLYSICEAFRGTSTYTSDDSGEIGAKSCMTACSNLRDDVAQICDRKYTDVKCGSLGQKIVKWIYKIIRMFRYVVPILLIILSILDYIKAIGNDSDDEMKKATGKFFKRLIVAAIIFTIPFILEFILKIFHLPGLDSTNPFCAN